MDVFGKAAFLPEKILLNEIDLLLLRSYKYLLSRARSKPIRDRSFGTLRDNPNNENNCGNRIADYSNIPINGEFWIRATKHVCRVKRKMMIHLPSTISREWHGSRGEFFFFPPDSKKSPPWPPQRPRCFTAAPRITIHIVPGGTM